MLNIIELSDSLLYVQSDRWRCSFGHGEPVRLGLILEAVDMVAGGEAGYSFVIDAHLIPQPEYLDEDIAEEARSAFPGKPAEQIAYVYESYGGVPVNIDALQPAKASCGFSGFVADSCIGCLKPESGEAMEVRHFPDQVEAMRFARDFYAVYAQGIFGFIDVVLDNPLRGGGTGWDKIRAMAKK